MSANGFKDFWLQFCGEKLQTNIASAQGWAKLV
jgi:hypothetical protein